MHTFEKKYLKGGHDLIRIADHELSVSYHMIQHAQVIATENSNNVLSHKNEKDRQLDRQGDVVGGSGKDGRYICGVKYIVDGSRFRLDF